MRKTAIAAMLLLCVFAAHARVRIVRAPRSQAFVHAWPSHPMGGWPVSEFIKSMKVESTTQLTWRMRLLTPPARPWTDAAWLGRHSRLSNGAFAVPVWRGRNGTWCMSQMLTVPAQPNQVVEFVLDMNFFAAPDVIMLELWPGYDFDLIASGDVGSLTLRTRSDPDHSLRLQSGNVVRCDPTQ